MRRANALILSDHGGGHVRKGARVLEKQSGPWRWAAQAGTSVLQPQQMHSGKNCRELGRGT